MAKVNKQYIIENQNICSTTTCQIIIIFLISLTPKLLYFFMFGMRQVSAGADAESYLRVAGVIWRHGVFGRGAGAPEDLDHFIYMFFLAPFVGLFGERPMPAIFAQYLLAAACAPLAFLTARRMGGNLAGWAAGLLCAAYLPLIVYPSRFITEALFTFLFFLVMYLADCVFAAKDMQSARRRAGLLGALLAVLALTRLIAFPLFLVPTTLFALFFWKKSPKQAILIAGLCCGVFAAAYSPWVIRNYMLYDKIVILRDYKWNFNGTHRVAQLISEGHDLEEAREIAGRYSREVIASGKEIDRDSPVGFLSAAYFRQCGQRFLIMMGLHFNLETRYPATGTTVAKYPVVRLAVHGWYFFMYPCIFGALLIGFLKLDIRILFTTLFPFALAVLYSLIGAIPRYQIPIFSAFCIPAGIFISLCVARLRRGRGREVPS